MYAHDNERLKNDIRTWASEDGRDRTALIPLLQKVQGKYSQISDYAMQVIADQLDIHPVEVYSVTSLLRLCQTISCDMDGKDRVARQLENDLGIRFGETTPDGKFTLEWANCLGMCDQGPALLVNDTIHTRVTAEKVHQIVDECRKTFGIYAVEAREDH
jgi:NADH:ubiquinone oxidoreductase subunit E